MVFVFTMIFEWRIAGKFHDVASSGVVYAVWTRVGTQRPESIKVSPVLGLEFLAKSPHIIP